MMTWWWWTPLALPLYISKHTNIRIIGMPEGEEEEEEIENLLEKTMKDNFPNLAKEIDF